MELDHPAAGLRPLVRPPADLVAARDRLKAWLLQRAYPIWWNPGADLEVGGFHDRLDCTGRPLPGPKRARVQARQVFCYAAAEKLGWDGPWRAAMTHGLDFLQQKHLRPDGLFRARVLAHGVDDDVDLYDQAFVLLACANAHIHGDFDAAAKAEALLARLPRAAEGGFANFNGGSLTANPNMHLFEACLAWAETGAAGPWREAAAGQAHLALRRLIDPATGAVSEVFGPGWSGPDAGPQRRVEPGHQFEWAWLLMRWSALAGDAGALRAALRLIELGERAGVDPARGVAVNALDGDLELTERGTRLWPQTERLKVTLLAGSVTGDEGCWGIALQAAEALWRFLDVPTPGLWRDSLEGEDDSAPASSLYHIVGAVLQLDRLVRGEV